MNSTGAGEGGDAETKHLAAISAIAELRHPHLVAMRPSESGGGFEADLSEGRMLSDLRDAQGGSLPLRAALRILLDVMSGLAALHRATSHGKPIDFVHGEVMPDNILVGRDGVARLVPLVKPHWSPGAPASPVATGYTAPEKLLGDDFDKRADVFSTGVLLWEAMMGKPLFRDPTVDDVVTQLVGGKVVQPIVAADAPWGADLADVVMRALSVDPADRWEHVGIMGADIETIAEGQVAKTSEIAALVTGRHVSRDSLSDEVTRRVSSLSSLTPFANSIPAAHEDALSADSSRRLDSVAAGDDDPLPASSAKRLRRPMDARRRWTIVSSALSFSVLLLAIAVYRSFDRPNASIATATVLAPAAMPSLSEAPIIERAAEPAAAVEPETPLETPPAAPSPPPQPETSAQVTAAQAAPEASPPPIEGSPSATQERKPSRAGSRPGAPAPRTSPSAAKAKPKDDPFGLMKPMKSKKKDDPFGL